MEVALKATRRTDSLPSDHDQEWATVLGSDTRKIGVSRGCYKHSSTEDPCPALIGITYGIPQDRTQPEVSDYQPAGILG